MNSQNPTQIHATGEATGFIPAPGDKGKPITVIGTAAIRDAFDATCIQQALNSRGAPGVTDLVLNPDAHATTVVAHPATGSHDLAETGEGGYPVGTGAAALVIRRWPGVSSVRRCAVRLHHRAAFVRCG